STRSSVRNKAPGTPRPKCGGSHHHLGSDTLTVMSFLPMSALSSRRSAQGAETRLCHQEGRWGWAPGRNRSDPSHFPVPAPQPCSEPLFCFNGCTPGRGPRRSPGALVKPRSARGRLFERSRPGRPPGPSCLSCPSLSSLGAEVSGPRSPRVPRG
ncbi:unnamed protein product, partial [Rangifer tarandus platyrhynchus]